MAAYPPDLTLRWVA